MAYGDALSKVKAQLGPVPLSARVVAERAGIQDVRLVSNALRKMARRGECQSSEVVTNGRRKNRYWTVDALP